MKDLRTVYMLLGHFVRILEPRESQKFNSASGYYPCFNLTGLALNIPINHATRKFGVI